MRLRRASLRYLRRVYLGVRRSIGGNVMDRRHGIETSTEANLHQALSRHREARGLRPGREWSRKVAIRMYAFEPLDDEVSAARDAMLERFKSPRTVRAP